MRIRFSQHSSAISFKRSKGVWHLVDFKFKSKNGIFTEFQNIFFELYDLPITTLGHYCTEIQNDEAALKRRKLVSKRIPIGPRNRFAGIIRKGVEQILDYDAEKKSYHIIWIHSAGEDPELHNRRFHSTLYGTEKLISFRRDSVITCYYFHDSAFFSWREFLDGAILTFLNNAQLCINTQSPRVEDFRTSELTLAMSSGLCDPQKLERQSADVMIADCNLDRKYPDGILRYIQGKYSLDHLQAIPMQQLTGMIAVPGDES